MAAVALIFSLVSMTNYTNKENNDLNVDQVNEIEFLFFDDCEDLGVEFAATLLAEGESPHDAVCYGTWAASICQGSEFFGTAIALAQCIGD